MPKKKKETPDVDDARDLKQQLEDYIKEIIINFEDLTGMTVTHINIRHRRRPGFGENNTVEIDAEILL